MGKCHRSRFLADLDARTTGHDGGPIVQERHVFLGEFEAFFSFVFPADQDYENPGTIKIISMAKAKWWPRSQVATVEVNLANNDDDDAADCNNGDVDGEECLIVSGSLQYFYELPEGRDEDDSISREHRPDKEGTILILDDARDRYDLRPGSFVPVNPEDVGSLFSRQLRRLQPRGGRVLFLFSKPI